MITDEDTITEEEAIARGLTQITTLYILPREQEMVEAAAQELKRGNIEYGLVRHPKLRRQGGCRYKQLSIWRKGAHILSGFDTPNAEQVLAN